MKPLLNIFSKSTGTYTLIPAEHTNMLLRQISLCFLLILASGSCQKDEKGIPDQVIGNWVWVKTIIPYSQEETNPRTDGYATNLYILKESHILCK
jgi:hypothetical protein